MKSMRVTLIYPCTGRRATARVGWSAQFEPLGPAVIAALTPPDVAVKFYDDRLERIPFDEATDLVGITVSTYTAKRAYQIASEYRARRVPVVMGGVHATLCPEEVAEYAEAVVIGEAEGCWAEVLDDVRCGRLKKRYVSQARPSLDRVQPRRNIFQGKPYLPVTFIETGRGCRFACEFCAVQSYFHRTYTPRPIDAVLRELYDLRHPRRLLSLTDDNLTADLSHAKSLCRALIPLRIRWASQASIHAARDPELLELMVRSGCQGLLMGVESVQTDTLRAMKKPFNVEQGGVERALDNLRRHRIPSLATFVLGYDTDSPDVFRKTLAFAKRHACYLVSFNPLMPYPGTPLYHRLSSERRLRYPTWWLDATFRDHMASFYPRQMSPEELEQGCQAVHRAFYTWSSIARRWTHAVNHAGRFTGYQFPLLNMFFRARFAQRYRHPFGDEAWSGRLLKAD